jgi:hypothetical protein
MKNVSVINKEVEHLNLFLQIIRNKMKYDASHDFNNADENEAAFLEYRKELSNIFKMITKLAPQLVASFVEQTSESFLHFFLYFFSSSLSAAATTGSVVRTTNYLGNV